MRIITAAVACALVLVLAASGGCGGRGTGPAAARTKDHPAKPAPEQAPVSLTAASTPAESPAAAPAPAPASQRKLFHAATSVDDLVRQTLVAVEAEDMQGLTDLRVTEREHSEFLWPEFPAKDHNVQLQFAWDMLNTRSYTNQGRAIDTWHGKGLELVEVRFERGIEPYKSFVLHRGTVIAARTAAGEEVQLRFIGSILELGGQFKVLSYQDKD